METSTRRDVLLPALVVLASGLVGLALRPGLPLDETRYLQVAREMDWNGPWLLTLNGEPYSHKPPLLLWLGVLLGKLGPGLEYGLRTIPVLASALTVYGTARLGRRHGAPLAGWAQAAFVVPLVYAHVLYFDALLTAFVVLAVWAWSAGRSAFAWVAASAALLTKGPAALLSLLPLLWAAEPADSGRGGLARAGRAVILGLLAFVPLALWALFAGWLGGPEFQRELWWQQTAERIAGASSHEQGPWFFLGVLAVGLLPATGVFFGRWDVEPRTAFVSRLPWAILVPLVLFSAFPGKLPHYVLPLFPMLAVLVARRIERAPRLLVRAPVVGMGVGFASALAYTWSHRGELLDRYGPSSIELAASRGFGMLLGLAFAAGIAAAVVGAHPNSRPRHLLAATCLSIAALLLPVERAFGTLLLPHEFARELEREPTTPLATLRSAQAGFYNWMTGRRHVDDLREVEELARWSDRHPGGLVIFEDKLWRDEPLAQALERVGLTAVRHDNVRGTPSTLWRVRGGPAPRP
ncbi:MAG: hypothetical protein IPJ77_02455 [Planctomycetes bacterium]|nr:hypothetical protein [Planctomycetota bacterium]